MFIKYGIFEEDRERSCIAPNYKIKDTLLNVVKGDNAVLRYVQ